MPWNSKPVVRDLGKYADTYNFKQAVVVGIRDDGMFEVVSYGKTAALCKKAKWLADQIHNNIKLGNTQVER